MEPILDRELPEVRIRAFRAVDEPETCIKYLEGHRHVLEKFNIPKVASANAEWMYNPAAFVFVVESLNREKLYGGARVLVAGGTQPLPIEESIGRYDTKIYELVKKHGIEGGTGEGCGLWNSREIAGYGIGSIFLSRVGVAIATQIGIKTLFGLCAPYTVNLAETIGYRVDIRLGNQGHFYYPRDDFKVTSMFYRDVNSLETATPEGQASIMSLRDNPHIVRIEELRKKRIKIHYDIEIPNIGSWSLEEAIENLKNEK